MIFIIVLATILSTFLGGLFAIRYRDKLHLILGFSAGAVLGVALFDLLPESISLASITNLRLVMLLVAIGFSLYLILDRFFSLHCHGDEVCENPGHRGKLGASALIFHSLIDGLAIGLAFKVSPTIGLIVTVAVLTHDFSDGINTVSMILKDSDNRGQALKWLIIDALAPAAGIIIAQFIKVNEVSLGLILAIFTGLFLYISASDLIPESHHRHPGLWSTILTILGMAVIFAAVYFVS